MGFRIFGVYFFLEDRSIDKYRDRKKEITNDWSELIQVVGNVVQEGQN